MIEICLGGTSKELNKLVTPNHLYLERQIGWGSEKLGSWLFLR